jgi:hypothetical protein
LCSAVWGRVSEVRSFGAQVMDGVPAGTGSPSVCRSITTFDEGLEECSGGLLVIGAVSSSGLLAVDLNSPGYYIHWGFFQISLANLIVILLMIVVFVVALFAPSPGGRNRQ